MSEQGATRVRASDAEREEVATVLRAAMSEGRLTLDEGEQRLAAVYAATYRDEFPALTADLPRTEPPPDPRQGSQRGPRDRAWRPVPAIGLVAVAAVAAGIWALAAEATLWPAILLGVLAVMLAKHSGRRHWQSRGYGPRGSRSHHRHPCHPAHRDRADDPAAPGSRHV